MIAFRERSRTAEALWSKRTSAVFKLSINIKVPGNTTNYDISLLYQKIEWGGGHVRMTSIEFFLRTSTFNQDTYICRIL